MIRNIIFDWSGTLVDDLPAVWKATNHVLVQAERPEMTLEQFRAEFCLPFTIFYDRHIPHIPLPQLRAMLKRGVERSYNRISVDGDTSTNDTLVLLANSASGVRPSPEKSRPRFIHMFWRRPRKPACISAAIDFA